MQVSGQEKLVVRLRPPAWAPTVICNGRLIVAAWTPDNLARAVLRPRKVRFQCPDCGLMTHDPDAVHCKACGRLLKIPNKD